MRFPFIQDIYSVVCVALSIVPTADVYKYKRWYAIIYYEHNNIMYVLNVAKCVIIINKHTHTYISD